LFNSYCIKYIKTDNSTKFFNYNFYKFYEDTGIIYLHTVKYNPSQNGRVEILYGILVTNGMLAGAKLNHKSWQDATPTDKCIHNKLPHKDNN